MNTHQTQMFKGTLRKLNRLARQAKALPAEEQPAEECPFSPVDGEDPGLDSYQDILDKLSSLRCPGNSILQAPSPEFSPRRSPVFPRVHDPPTAHAPLTAEV